MADEKKDSKLTRLALGGPEQLPGFTGNLDDYSLINEVIFRAKRNGKEVISDDTTLYYRAYQIEQAYKPEEPDSFLRAVNEVLEDNGWYLLYCVRNTTFMGCQRVTGDLYNLRNRKQTQEPPKTD